MITREGTSTDLPRSCGKAAVEDRLQNATALHMKEACTAALTLNAHGARVSYCEVGIQRSHPALGLTYIRGYTCGYDQHTYLHTATIR